MCTVTYIPLLSSLSTSEKSTKFDFLLTSNRDEKTARTPALMPEIFHINHKKVAFPSDPVGKGSWIAMQENGNTVCLLNGGFNPHISKLPYRHSRGLVVTQYFKYKNVYDFATHFDCIGLEPFTLVVVENGQLFELRWDETELYKTALDTRESYIWSSVTLYSPEVRLKREKAFKKWLSANFNFLQFNQELIFDFHQFKSQSENEESIAINREDFLKTVSITSVKKLGESASIEYKDLIHDQNEIIKFGIQAFKTTV